MVAIGATIMCFADLVGRCLFDRLGDAASEYGHARREDAVVVREQQAHGPTLTVVSYVPVKTAKVLA